MDKEEIRTLADLAPMLQGTSNRQELAVALEPLFALGEPAVLRLIQETGREKTSETAFMLTVLGDLAPSAALRKAARTALHRLHSLGIKPRVAALTMQAPKPAFVPTFYEGYASLMRETGEIDLILAWNRPQNQIQSLVFLLDYWQKGIKDAFVTEEMSKRRFQKYVSEARQKGAIAASRQFVPCTLDQGRALIREALELNERLHVALPNDYIMHYSTIKHYLGDPKAWPAEQTVSEVFITPTLRPRQVTEYAIGAFGMGDFGLFYDLHQPTHELCQSATRLDFLTRSAPWRQGAERGALGITILERQDAPDELATLNSVEIEIFWSLSWKADSIGQAPALLSAPLRTDVDTGRSWFWTVFVLERTERGWRIAADRDGAAGLRKLLPYDLQARATAEGEQFKELAKDMKPIAKLQRDLAKTEQMARHGYVGLVCYDLLFSSTTPKRREIMVEAAELALEIGDVDRAISWGEQMMANHPDKGICAGELGRLYFSAFYLLRDEEPDTAQHYRLHALQNLELSLERKPAHNVKPYLLLARLYSEDRRQPEAEALLKTAQDIEPDNREVLGELGTFYGRQQRNKEALGYLTRLIELDPAYPRAHFSLGLVYRQFQQNEKALEEFALEVEQHPDDAYAYNELGLTSLLLNDQQSALEALQRAVELSPENGGFHADVAMAAAVMGRDKLARDELHLAEQLAPNSPRIQQAKRLLLR